MKPTNKLEIQQVIAFSRLVCKTLSKSDCILLHQSYNQGVQLSEKLKTKYRAALNEMKSLKWKKPELKYDDNYYLWYYDEALEQWKKVNNNQ